MADASSTLEVAEFIYHDKPLRVVMLDNQPWFAAADVRRIVGVYNLAQVLNQSPHDHLFALDAHRLVDPNRFQLSRGDVVWFVNELAVYDLALQRGQWEVTRWFIGHVSPTVRERGLPSITRAELQPPRSSSDQAALLRVVARLEEAYQGTDAATPQQDAATGRAISGRPSEEGPHVLYRLYGDKDRLLYVGISMQVAARISAHKSGQPWFHLVRAITVEHHPDRETVMTAEKKAIRRERPRYNREHKQRR